MTSKEKTRGLSAWGEMPPTHGPLWQVDPLLNKGTAFTQSERDALGLRALLPPVVFTLEQQAQRSYNAVRRIEKSIDKYIYLASLQNRNEILFYRLCFDHIEEMLPYIYTPTVGEACLQYGSIYRRQRGLFLNLNHRGSLEKILRKWPRPGVRLIVVTDGERILGLGDLGALGMGIPVGKLSLYTLCAGVHPYYTLPITLDVGTNNPELLDGPAYIGIKQKRVRGADYDSFIEEFVLAVKAVFPSALLQWEDFGNTNAFRILRTYRHKLTSFNDDIQGTAAVTLAGVIAALRITGGRLAEQKILFLGAGEANTGIAALFITAARREGLSEAEARLRCWFIDSSGLVTQDRRAQLAEHKLAYAHPHAPIQSLVEAIKILRPTVLIGASGSPGSFTREVVEQMSAINPRPIIFALSNPTAKAECTPEQAYGWSGGRVIFATGSPFPPVELNGVRYVPGQCNNIYIFPAVGLGALVSEAREVTDEMFFVAAQTLAKLVKPEDLAVGRVYPPLSNIREVSIQIATAVAVCAYDSDIACTTRPADIAADIRSRMFYPVYREYV